MSDLKDALLANLQRRYGRLTKVSTSQSLFELDGGARIYVRYSKVHGGDRTFYGLRREDLGELEGRQSFVCLLWDGQDEPLFLPYRQYEHVFANLAPAPDGQYKVQVFLAGKETELYIARAGRFNVESNFGFGELETLVHTPNNPCPELGHSQVQTLLGSIGATLGYAVWIPSNNRLSLDWQVSRQFDCCETLPPPLAPIQSVAQEIDVIWMKRGSSDVHAMFEVEHSTTVYSGLLRFNDVLLVAPQLVDRFHVVADDERRDLFVRQLSRPTFQRSGLANVCSFMDYCDVFRWHLRMQTSA